MVKSLPLLWQQLVAFFLKELQLLRRDRGGLIVLFVMPIALVVIVSLVQDNILKVSGARTVKLLLVDQDQGCLGQELLKQLEHSGSFQVSCKTDDYLAAKQAVNAGQWQVGIYLPAGVSQQLDQRAMQQVRNSFNSVVATETQPPLTIEYFFDPAVQGGLQGSISGMLRQLVNSEVLKMEMSAFQTMLPAQIERQVSVALGPMFAQALAQNKLHLNFPEQTPPLLQVVLAPEDNAQGTLILPTSVQHNVPAWSLFGIFFIILPLSGVVLQERFRGIFPRILLLPGSHLGMLLGRLLAYLSVCLVQFCLMLSVGFYILPRLGTDALQLNGQGAPLLLVALCAALTACGFGLLLGAMARSEQQAIMLAAVAIVICAALGGIMVPVYMMPPLMQQLSVVSPLGWGLEACQVLLLRGGSLQDILPQLLTMFSCFVVCLILSWRRLCHVSA
jgi:ABC-2 type transport system permease protein